MGKLMEAGPFDDPYWLPTSENINDLPDPIRRYIRDLETRVDPAGDIQRIEALERQVAHLSAYLSVTPKILSALKDIDHVCDDILKDPSTVMADVEAIQDRAKEAITQAMRIRWEE